VVESAGIEAPPGSAQGKQKNSSFQAKMSNQQVDKHQIDGSDPMLFQAGLK
jgi:hypothetical protein